MLETAARWLKVLVSPLVPMPSPEIQELYSTFGVSYFSVSIPAGAFVVGEATTYLRSVAEVIDFFFNLSLLKALVFGKAGWLGGAGFL